MKKSSFLPNEIRTAFHEKLRKEVNSRNPEKAAKILYSEVPEQLEFDFTTSNVRFSQ
jgi:hypothetical protein